MNINDISNRTIFRVLMGITLFAVLIFLIIRVHRELVWVVTAGFLALALNPAVESLSRYIPGKRRGLATSAVFIVMLALVSFMVVNLVPPLVRQTQELVRELPTIADKLQSSDGTVARFARDHNLVQVVKDNQSQLVTKLSSFSGSFVNVAKSIATSLLATLTVLVMTFFMLVEGPMLFKQFWSLNPKPLREHRQKLAAEMYKAISGYVTGNLLTSLIAAITSAIALTITGVGFAIPLGILVGIFDLIPLVGATIAAVVVCGLTLLYADFTAAIIMAIFFVVYQQLENHFLQPLVYSRTVKMSPLTVLVAAILGGSLAGLLGALLAIPVASCSLILAKDYLKKHPRD